MLGWFEEIRIYPIGLRRQTWARDSKDTTSEKKIQILSTQVPLEFQAKRQQNLDILGTKGNGDPKQV